MSNQKCLECGLIEQDQEHQGKKQCLALKRNLNPDDLNRGWDCYYYISIIKEDGEPLTPFEHYLIKLDEIEKKKVSVINTALA